MYDSPASPGKHAVSPELSRVELTLDSGHGLPNTNVTLADRKAVERAELKRIASTAKGARRGSLEAEIENLQTQDAKECGDGPPRDAREGARSARTASSTATKGARPWSARPMSARNPSVLVMKTIPESKQHAPRGRAERPSRRLLPTLQQSSSLAANERAGPASVLEDARHLGHHVVDQRRSGLVGLKSHSSEAPRRAVIRVVRGVRGVGRPLGPRGRAARVA